MTTGRTHSRWQQVPPTPACARCNKVAAATRAIAVQMKHDIELRTGRTDEVRYYQCADGWWHWTRRGIWGEAGT